MGSFVGLGGLGVIEEYSTAYILPDGLYREMWFNFTGSPEIAFGVRGFCARPARDHADKFSEFALQLEKDAKTNSTAGYYFPGALKIMAPQAMAAAAEMQKDLYDDPSMGRYGACVYPDTLSLDPYRELRVKSHEKFHAFLIYMGYKRQWPLRMSTNVVKSRGSSFSLMDEKLANALDQFGTDVGADAYRVSVANRWSLQTGSEIEEFLARIVELEAATNSKNGKWLSATNKELVEAIVKARTVLKLPYDALPDTTFRMLERRIRKKYGSVRAFIEAIP